MFMHVNDMKREICAPEENESRFRSPSNPATGFNSSVISFDKRSLSSVGLNPYENAENQRFQKAGKKSLQRLQSAKVS
jgi:hypothetical protein